MSSVASVFIDEVDVTEYALEGSSTRRLNRPSDAMVRLPMQHAIGDCGSLLKIYFDGVLHHHGRVLLCETQCDENGGYTVYNSTDPLEMWKWRPVRDPGGAIRFTSSCGTQAPLDDPGDFSKPDLITDFRTGPEIVEAMMFASENIALGPDDAEGPLFLQRDTFECGGANLDGAPVDWPMTMAQLATVLVGTGALDIVVDPIELDLDGNYGRISAYNGAYGTDRRATVIFQYGMGAFNVRALRWNNDMTHLCNKLWYLLGPKCDEQHWQANVTGASTDAFWEACGNGPFPAATWKNWHDNVVACTGTDEGLPPDSMFDGDSRGRYGVRMDIKIYDALGDATDCIETMPTGIYCLYKKLWLEEQWLRQSPLSMKYVTPTRDTEIGTFDIGDLVTVEASPKVKGGFSGVERIYEYTIAWDAQDSVPALAELQTSAGNEGFD